MWYILYELKAYSEHTLSLKSLLMTGLKTMSTYHLVKLASLKSIKSWNNVSVSFVVIFKNFPFFIDFYNNIIRIQEKGILKYHFPNLKTLNSLCTILKTNFSEISFTQTKMFLLLWVLTSINTYATNITIKPWNISIKLPPKKFYCTLLYLTPPTILTLGTDPLSVTID